MSAARRGVARASYLKTNDKQMKNIRMRGVKTFGGCMQEEVADGWLKALPDFSQMGFLRL